jgi:protoporphyrinogen IX oxidase
MLLGKGAGEAAGVLDIKRGILAATRGGVMLPDARRPFRLTLVYAAHYNHSRGGGGSAAMLWLKAFHVVFVVTWFAGLFYLPRLFVYHVATPEPAGRERFAVMERRLFAIMTIGAVAALALGLAMVAAAPAYLAFPWLRAKLVLVAVLIGYHAWCLRLMRQLRSGAGPHSQRWYRLFNEVPALLLIAIVILAVVKP